MYLDNGGDKFAVDGPTGRTTLHIVAVSNSVSSLNNLLNQGLELEARNKNGETPLDRAAAYGVTEIVQRLVDAGAVNRKGQTPFLVSIKAGANKVVSEVLLKGGSSVHVADKDGNAALHIAVRLPSILKEIIKKGGDVNAVNVRGSTPLHEAAYNGYPPDATRILLKAGGNVHSRDEQGNTPLHIAVSRGYDDIAEFLAKNGSDVHATDIKWKIVRTHVDTFSC